MANNEHQFESDIESLMVGELGWKKSSETGYLKSRELALDLGTLLAFVKSSQPKVWATFTKSCSGLDPAKEFYKKFESADKGKLPAVYIERQDDFACRRNNRSRYAP